VPRIAIGGESVIEADEFADFDTGEAVYRVAGVGAFTLGWDPNHLPDADPAPGEERLRVSYGIGPRSFVRDEAPVLFGVTLAGEEFFLRSRVPEGLRLRPYRLVINAPVRVAKGTARRTSAIVTALARHWLAQPWTPDLRRAHEHHNAPHALHRYGGLIAEHEERMRQLREHRAYYVERARQATAVLQAGPIPAPADAPPHPHSVEG
jgi:hypothetical protein